MEVDCRESRTLKGGTYSGWKENESKKPRKDSET